jgi:hypothetical protein
VTDIAEEPWHEAESWPPEAVAELVAQAVADYQEGKFSRDFVDKLADRGIPLQAVIGTVANRQSLIVEYADRRDDSRRIGFWHPRLKYFVAWKPGTDSRYMTCFWREDGLAYAQRLSDSRPIRRPEGEEP